MAKTSWMSIAVLLLSAGSLTAQEPGKYWLGLWCSPIPPSLRAQLINLPEKQGVLVLGVAPDSPASRAGLAMYDVLLQAGDKPLAAPGDLIQAIETAKEGKLKIELIRGGTAKTVEAAPAKRPEDVERNATAAPGDRDWETMNQWFQEHERWTGEEGDNPQSHARYRFIHPGVIVPQDVLVPSLLPPNTSIDINKDDNQPVKITVKRGDEKWEVTEKELDKLPKDIRPHVERMLGRGPLGVVGGPPMFDFVPAPTFRSDAWESRIEKRLDEMNQRMDRIIQALEQSMQSRDHRDAGENHGKVFYP